MADSDKTAKVVNKAGTLKMTDDVAATKTRRDISGKNLGRRNNRRDRSRNQDTAPKDVPWA